jgi:hypothetical protein
MRHKVTRARQAGLCRKIGVGSVLALSAGAVGACADSTLDDLPIRTDSAGVSIVHYPSLPSVENSRLAIADEPELTLGHERGEPAYEFFTIAGVVRLGDGSLVVANAGTMELRVFSPDGRFLGAFGGRGEGPGELSFMRGLWITGGDSLVVWDGQSKFNLFSPSGEFVRTGALHRNALHRIPLVVLGAGGAGGWAGHRFPLPALATNDGRARAWDGAPRFHEPGRRAVGLGASHPER